MLLLVQLCSAVTLQICDYDGVKMWLTLMVSKSRFSEMPDHRVSKCDRLTDSYLLHMP